MIRKAVARIGVPPVHPFLFAVFPILSMFSSNIGEAAPGETVMPILVMLALAAPAWVVLSVPVADRLKRAVVLSALWLPFHAYGFYVDWVINFRPMMRIVLIDAALLLVAAVCVWLAWMKRDFGPATRFLNVTAICVVSLTLLLAANRVRERRQFTVRPVVAEPVPAGSSDDPDIYFIILDSYTRQDYLQEMFGHDNGPFLEELRARGFHVADRSRSNYASTQESLATTLNMSFVHEDLNNMPLESPDKMKTVLSKLTWNSEVVRTLRERGYEFVTYASSGLVRPVAGFGPDRTIEPKERRLTDLQRAWVDRTPLRSAAFRFIEKNRPVWYFHALDHLPKLKRRGRPIFAFVHVLSPHTPHKVDANGNRVTDPPYHEGYRNEVRYLNKRLPDVVDSILAKHPNSIFVIQGDHGPSTDWGEAKGRPEKKFDTWREYVRDRTLILNVHYFPDRVYEGRLYPEITPVNSFRVIFNAFFGMNLERLEDKSYVAGYDVEDPSYHCVTEVY